MRNLKELRSGEKDIKPWIRGSEGKKPSESKNLWAKHKIINITCIKKDNQV